MVILAHKHTHGGIIEFYKVILCYLCKDSAARSTSSH